MGKKTLLLMFILLGSMLIPIISMAWSPPVQSIRLVTVNPPEDLEVVLVTPIYIECTDGAVNPSPWISSRLWETSYSFTLTRYGERLDYEWLTFQFSSNELGTFTMDLPLQGEWSTVLYMNLNNQTYSFRPYWWRNLRILLTWIIWLILAEAFYFLIFSNRSKRHWEIFAHHNSLTQGLFIICWFLFALTTMGGISLQFMFIGIPLFFALFGLRIFKLVLDLWKLPKLLPEVSKGRTITYVLLANFSSGIMIIFLVIEVPFPEVRFLSTGLASTAFVIIRALLSKRRKDLGWRNHKQPTKVSKVDYYSEEYHKNPEQ